MAIGELQEHYGLLLGLVPPWAVAKVELDLPGKRLVLSVDYPAGAQVPCPETGCRRSCRVKDHREERIWRHLDTMQFETLVKSRVPRSDCPEHGVKTIQVPWAGPRSPFTLLFEKFAIEVLKSARSIRQAQALLGISWDQVQRIQEIAVSRGLARRELEELGPVGMDEKNFGRGHSYVSVLSDLQQGRVLEVVKDRTEAAADQLWQTIPEAQRLQIPAVAMDMWEAFMNSARTNAPQADIVHDKFHVASYLSKAVDGVRKKEHREFRQNDDDTLTGSKYLWLTNPKNWSEEQKAQFRMFRREGLKVSRAWAIKEEFTCFWDYVYPKAAENFFDRWYYWATHSRLQPVIEVARTLKRHLAGLLTYCKHRITNAVSEGLNSKIQSIKANARGFRNFDHYRISILFHCGKLELFP
jgi:transposase